MKKIDIKNGWVVNWVIIALVALGLFAAYALSGCMTEKKINKFKQQYCKDSISIQIKERIVKIPILYNDSAMLDIWLQCDSIQNIYYSSWQYYQGKYTEIKTKLDNNKISIKSVVNIKDSIHYIERDTNRYQQANVITNELTKGQQTRQHWFWYFLIENIVFILLLLLYIFIKFKTKILGFFKPK
jgi:hypothetical protein